LKRQVLELNKTQFEWQAWRSLFLVQLLSIPNAVRAHVNRVKFSDRKKSVICLQRQH
jgi:hypothetical protein